MGSWVYAHRPAAQPSGTFGHRHYCPERPDHQASWKMSSAFGQVQFHGPILWCLGPTGTVVAKRLLLNPAGAAAVRGVTSGEGDARLLPPGKGAGPPMGLLKSIFPVQT